VRAVITSVALASSTWEVPCSTVPAVCPSRLVRPVAWCSREQPCRLEEELCRGWRHRKGHVASTAALVHMRYRRHWLTLTVTARRRRPGLICCVLRVVERLIRVSTASLVAMWSSWVQCVSRAGSSISSTCTSFHVFDSTLPRPPRWVWRQSVSVLVPTTFIHWSLAPATSSSSEAALPPWPRPRLLYCDRFDHVPWCRPVSLQRSARCWEVW